MTESAPTDPTRADAADRPDGNPLLSPSPLPYQLPPFGQIRSEHFEPAMRAGMTEQLADIAAITGNPAEPTFVNTVEALERTGTTLDRAAAVFYNLVSSVGGDDLRDVERTVAPLLSAHQDAIRLDRALFARIEGVYRQRADAGLDAEQLRLVERVHLDFVLSGAGLGPAEQQRLRELNGRITVASTAFGQNLQQSSEAASVRVDDPAELTGLSADAVAAAVAAAQSRGLAGAILPLVLPTPQPVLAQLTNRELRRRVHLAAVGRSSAGEFDNGPVAVEIARLRAERARLLGFATHADTVLADQTAGSVATVDEFLLRLVGPALANARAEADELRAEAAADGVELAPWDWAFYAEKVRARRFDLDTAALSPFFELQRVLQDGVFYAARELYGIEVELRPDLAGYHPDVAVYQVSDPGTGPFGLLLVDCFARDGKRGGAWMSSFVEQSTLLDQHPVVVLNLNVDKPAPGRSAFLTLDEVDTLFHEFGHVLHGLFSRVRYPRFSGTSVPRDFVEFPSQVNEMWAMWPEVIDHYAVHAETGAALPAATVEALRAAQTYGEGFRTTEFLGATLLDQAWHRIAPEERIDSAADFEAAALAEAGVAFDLIPPRYRTGYFQHVFAGGYSAGYYSYIWAEVLDADVVEWFTGRGGLRRESGEQFRRELLSVGGSRDPMAAFRSVVGREPDIEPLLRRRRLAGVG